MSDSQQLAAQLVAHLAAHGVRDVVLSPGSRSAPLAYALLAADDVGLLRLTVRVDERSAGFVALGLARARGIAAVVTTSGTAVANLHPAVLEAHHAGVPLVVVSADRPAELRHTGASQTTAQPGIFAGAVRYCIDLPADAPDVRGQVARAVLAARGADPGPVHLNVQLRPPLAPQRPVTLPRVRPGVRTPEAPPQAHILPAGPRSVVVAGDGVDPDVVALAAAAGWPLLAEPTAREGADPAVGVRYYRELLAAGAGDAIERVVVTGRPTLSRPVSALLADSSKEIVVVSRTRYPDVAGTAALVVPAVTAAEPDADRAWLQRWREADDALAAATELSDHERAAHAVWRAGGNLLLGASSVIRAFETAPYGAATRAWANRGLAGIDGTQSTAFGLALGLGQPVRAVVGDLTYVHDAAGLVRGVLEADADVQVVVLDDAGGSIFATLEYGALPGAAFDRLFRTAQDFDLQAAAAAVGASYRRVELNMLDQALSAPWRGREVLHVRVDVDSLRGSGVRRAELARRIVPRSFPGSAPIAPR